MKFSQEGGSQSKSKVSDIISYRSVDTLLKIHQLYERSQELYDQSSMEGHSSTIHHHKIVLIIKSI